MRDPKKIFMDSVEVSAEIAKKQALIKKHELTDLATIHLKLGNYAYLNNIGRKQLHGQFKAIESLDAAVLHNNRSQEAVLLRRKSLIIELGRTMLQHEVEDETVFVLRQEAQSIDAEISRIKGEVAELQQHISVTVRRNLLAGVIAVLGLVLLIETTAGLKSGCSQDDRIQRTARESYPGHTNIQQEVSTTQKEMLDLEMEIKGK